MLENKIQGRLNVQHWRTRNKELVKKRAKSKYYLKRLMVLKLLAERDSYGKICCSECGSTKSLDIHHQEKLEDNFKARHYRWEDLENLEILCRSCHRFLHNQLTKEFKEKRIPENPSVRAFPQKWECNYCKRIFDKQDNFVNHLEKEGHRVCYKCGQKVGGWREWTTGKFKAKRIILKDGTETWRYSHLPRCPSSNPSQRIQLN